MNPKFEKFLREEAPRRVAGTRLNSLEHISDEKLEELMSNHFVGFAHISDKVRAKITHDDVKEIESLFANAVKRKHPDAETVELHILDDEVDENKPDDHR